VLKKNGVPIIDVVSLMENDAANAGFPGSFIFYYDLIICAF